MIGYEPSPLDVVVGSPILATVNAGGVGGGRTGLMTAMVEGAMRAGMQSNVGRNRREVNMDNLLRLRDEYVEDDRLP
jgi:hypothetical protein